MVARSSHWVLNQENMRSPQRATVQPRRFGPLLAGVQQALDLSGGSRWIEEISLYLVAAFRAENRELFVCLDAFRCRRDAQAPGDYRANDGYGVVARRELVHERSIDLDLVE